MSDYNRGWTKGPDAHELYVEAMEEQAQSSLAPARGSAASEPTTDEMRKELKAAGWIEKYSHVWMTPDGRHYRGPALAWHMMAGKPWPPNAELSEPPTK
jgi:hypothetical protein